ncbi:MAG: DUF1080 domain-containing protein [Bryobacterales bacterium]|nr:DUF1080 domain-containing protein [Bryobacterales bacterium]
MRKITLMLAVLAWTSLAAFGQGDGWETIFNGKNLDGWEANENPGSWTVENGVIVGRGAKSHLFYKKETFKNLHFKATVKLNHKGNSGMYFRTAWGPGFPTGYEAQVENSSGDPKKTGSLYNFSNFYEQIIPDDTWWTQEIIANGNHIIIKVNGRVITDYVDPKNTYTDGYVAFQQHDPGSVVMYKDVMVKRLP